MLRSFVLLVPPLLATVSGVRAESAAAPATPTKPAEPAKDAEAAKQAALEPKISLHDFLAKLPGTWTGVQYVQSPNGKIMTIHVKETYRWQIGAPGRPDMLVGEQTYTVKVGAAEHVTRGVSRTWVDKDGKGRSEVEQGDSKEQFRAIISVDTLVFIPEAELEKPKSLTSVHLVTKDGAPAMEVKGFQTAGNGTFLIQGLLKREGDVPVAKETK